MSTSGKIHRLAIEHFNKFNQLQEKRRQIDFDMAAHLKQLENNNQTVEGKVAVLDYKDKIANEEEFHLQLREELKEISEEFIPLLVFINANRIDCLETNIQDQTYIKSFIDEDGKIISTGPITKLN